VVNTSLHCIQSNNFDFTNTTLGASNFINSWDFGDGSTSTSISPTHSYKNIGTYKVKLTLTNSNGCTDTISQFVSVLSSKAVFTVNNTTECFTGNSFKFSNKSTVTTPSVYLWDFGDGTTSDSVSPTHTYTQPGSYTVLLQATSNGTCVDTISKKILVNGSIASFAVNNLSECFKGNSFTFTNNTKGVGTISYLWNFGDGNTSTSTSPVYSYSSAGTYKVRMYSTTIPGCVDSASANLTVNPKVFVSFKVNNLNQCMNTQNFAFTNSSNVSSGSLNYQWNFGDGSVFSAATNPNHKYNTAGNYIVKLTVTSDKGCIDTLSASLEVLPIPTAIIAATGATTFCLGSQVVLSGNTGTGNSYLWLKDGNKIIPSVTTSSYTATNGGKYTFVVTNSNGCSDTSSGITVIVNPLPLKPVVSQNGRLLFTSVYIAYQWNLAGSPLNGETAISYLPALSKGDYTVTVYDNNSCSNTSDTYHYDVSGIEISNLNTLNIKVYPNPAHDYLNIDLTNTPSDFEQLQLIDINGKLVKNLNISRKNYFQLFTGDMVNGFYYIRLTGKYGAFVQKIIIE